VYRLLKGVKISISTDRNVNNEFIPGYSKNLKHFGPPAGHVKVTFSLVLERISKKYESVECFLPGVEYYLW
jgi:hypothetical protein